MAENNQETACGFAAVPVPILLDVPKNQPFRVLPFLGWASSELQRLQRNCCELSFPPHLLQRRSFNFLANLVSGRSPISMLSYKLNLIGLKIVPGPGCGNKPN
jgi:hypothetical protein